MYSFTRRIGEGTYGEVFLAKAATKSTVAVKKLSKRKVNMKKLKREEDCLNRVKGCDGVVKLLDSYEDEENYYLVFDYIRGEDLLSLIMKRKSALPEESAKIIFRQFCWIMKDIHNSKVIHHDLKSENLMIDPLTLKTTLIDFGLSELVSDDTDATQRDSGSYEYLAPEKILDSTNFMYAGKEGHFSGYKSDIWGMGVILYAMLYAQFPWSKSERRQYIKDFGKHPDLKFPEKYDWISSDAKDMLNKLLSFDFEKRPSIDEVLAHPWLKERRQTFPFAVKAPLRTTKSK